MAQFDLGSILSAVSDQLTQLSSQKEEVKGKLEENKIMREATIAGAEKKAGMEQEILQSDLNQQLQLEETKKATARAFNVDMSDPNNRIAALAKIQADATDEALARSARASELIDLNIFDSPLSYMVERPFAGRHQEAATEAAKRATLADKAIMDLNQQAQSTVQTQKAINTELTIDEAGKRAQLAAMQAEDVVRATKMAANTSYLADLKTLRSLDAESLQVSSEAYKLRRHEQEFQARMGELQASRELRAKQKKSELEDLEYLFTRYNTGAELLGRAKAQTLADFQNMLKFNKKAVIDIAEKGETVWTDPSGTQASGRIAPTPGQAKVQLEYYQGSLPLSAERVSNLLNNENAAAQQSLRGKVTGKITADDLANELNTKLMGSVQVQGKSKVKIPGLIPQMLDNVEQDFGVNKNIYKAPDVETMAKAVPALTQFPAWREVVIPARSIQPVPTVQQMLDQGKLAIASGKLGVDEVADFISLYHTSALRVNEVNEQYSRVALPTPTSSYPVKLKSAGKVNATNAAQLKHYLVNANNSYSFDALGFQGD